MQVEINRANGNTERLRAINQELNHWQNRRIVSDDVVDLFGLTDLLTRAQFLATGEEVAAIAAAAEDDARTFLNATSRPPSAAPAVPNETPSRPARERRERRARGGARDNEDDPDVADEQQPPANENGNVEIENEERPENGQSDETDDAGADQSDESGKARDDQPADANSSFFLQQRAGLPTWAWFVIGGVVLLLIIVVIVALLSRRKEDDLTYVSSPYYAPPPYATF